MKPDERTEMLLRGEGLYDRFLPYPMKKNGQKEVHGYVLIDEIYWKGGKMVYCNINISLLTDEMFEYDKALLNFDSDSALNYKMFFYEFYSYTHIKIDLLHRMMERHQNGEEEFNSNCIQFWSKIRIYSLDEMKQFEGNREELIEGNILFSASPVIGGKIYIKILDDSVLPNNPSNMESLIYNVGQGNCIYNKLDGIGVFSDIGLTTSVNDSNGNIIQKACKEIGKLKSNLVVLSHWDLDHILGMTINNPTINNSMWIAPDYSEARGKTVSIIRLCAFLKRQGADINLITDEFASSQIYQSPSQEITIWKGRYAEKNKINAKNNYGLIMNIHGKYDILLPGDCDYDIIDEIVPPVFSKEYEYIVVPHHGSRTGSVRLKKSTRNRVAYISSGTIAKNFVFDSSLPKTYRNLNYRVKNTKNLKKCIKFRARIK